jgi:predicted nucleic acid-binding Zn ribbon protein
MGSAELGDSRPIADGITYSVCAPVGADACVCSESCGDFRYSDRQRDWRVAVTLRVRRLGRASTLVLPLRDQSDVSLVQVCGVHEPRIQGDYSAVLGATRAVQDGYRDEYVS